MDNNNDNDNNRYENNDEDDFSDMPSLISWNPLSSSDTTIDEQKNNGDNDSSNMPSLISWYTLSSSNTTIDNDDDNLFTTAVCDNSSRIIGVRSSYQTISAKQLLIIDGFTTLHRDQPHVRNNIISTSYDSDDDLSSIATFNTNGDYPLPEGHTHDSIDNAFGQLFNEIHLFSSQGDNNSDSTSISIDSDLPDLEEIYPNTVNNISNESSNNNSIIDDELSDIYSLD